jgi:predicted O-methyltransferase YrrM
MLGPRADDSSAPPEAWLWRESRDGRLPLYAAIHPVTGDQLLTRDPSEPAALGYDGAALLGYLVSAAPVTGTLERPVARIAWAPRYGEAADGAGDLWRAEIASPAAATSPGGPPLPAFVPAGHFYSPICDPAEITARAEQIWPAEPRAMPGIDWRESAQLELCALFAAQDELPLRRDQSDDESEYWELNDQFGALDARLLAAMLRHRRPARMIEIGSGYSSLISARVNRECLGRTMTFTCVEPFPRQFLIDGVDGISDLRVELVQDTPLELFDELGEGDVLFIDSSHTAKTGSDVVWLFDEVVPRLAPGVAVHLHDIFLPGDYPREWVMQGRGWNEQYLVRAFLAYNGVFRILLGAQFMIQRHRTALLDAFGSIDPKLLPGGSLWFERVAR